jgi:hypothetical protein
VSEIVYSTAGQGGGYIITGGKDGKVKLHDAFMRHLFEVNVCKAAECLVDLDCNPISFSSSRAPYVKALALRADGARLAVGTSASEIFEFDLSTPEAFKTEAGRSLLVQGHASTVDSKVSLKRRACVCCGGVGLCAAACWIPGKHGHRHFAT